MRATISREFGNHKPSAIVLDDDAAVRVMTSRRLKTLGFEVKECSSVQEFFDVWIPGTVDVIISDWQLSQRQEEEGERVLAKVRKRDWGVPFVLVSGRLGEAEARAGVLESLLESMNARFIERGEGDVSGIAEACEAAEDLIERRDLALLKVILALRTGALRGDKITTTSGEVTARELLADLVSTPTKSHDAERPVAAARNLNIKSKK